MPVIDLSKGGGRVIRRSIPQIQGKKMIGRGMFAAVYDNGDSVFKLTSDQHAYMFHADGVRPEGEHFPTLVTDYGEVGVTGEHRFYLVEVEKLRPTRHVRQAHEIALRLENALDEATKYDKCPTRAAENAIMRVTEPNEHALPESLIRALEELRVFITNIGSALDLHIANMMARPNGDLVLSDPIFDEGYFSAYLEGRSRPLAA